MDGVAGLDQCGEVRLLAQALELVQGQPGQGGGKLRRIAGSKALGGA